MTAAYVDGASGASGDMLLGALLDAGWAETELRQTLALLGLPGWELRVERVVQHGVAATRVRFDLPEQPAHRHLHDLLALLAAAALPANVHDGAVRVLRALAVAEARVHGTSPEEVHFHEVGALDTLFDVVGAAAGLAALGVDRLLVGPVNVGGGTVRTIHGVLPVPPPAVALLAQPLLTYGTAGVGELLTPTGAALLATFGQPAGAMPELRLWSIGYGAGQKELAQPNVVRLMIGTPAEPQTQNSEILYVLSCNIDDMNPELYSFLGERLNAVGALDVWTTPIVMKKGRPAVLLSVLCRADDAPAVRTALFRETTTLGVRTVIAQRDSLERRWQTVRTPYGDIRIKLGLLDGELVNRAPEYEDCAAAARKHGVPLKVVYEAAHSASGAAAMEEGTRP